MDKLLDIVWASRFPSGAKGAVFTPSKGLAVDDRAGNAPVDIEIACNDFLFPHLLLPLIESMNAACQPIGSPICDSNRLFNVMKGDKAKYWPKKFGLMGEASRFSIEFDTRRPQMGIVFVFFWHKKPPFARLKFKKT